MSENVSIGPAPLDLPVSFKEKRLDEHPTHETAPCSPVRRKRDRDEVEFTPSTEKVAKGRKLVDRADFDEGPALFEENHIKPNEDKQEAPKTPKVKPVLRINLSHVAAILETSPEPTPRSAEHILKRHFTDAATGEPLTAKQIVMNALSVRKPRALGRTYTCPDTVLREVSPMTHWRQLKEEFKCAICCEVLIRPVDPVQCGHFVCRSHVIELAQFNRNNLGCMRCPVCREERMVDDFNSIEINKELWTKIINGKFHDPRKRSLSPSRSKTPLQDRFNQMFFSGDF